MGTPTSNSSRQIVHSAESTQSFSVAVYGNMPVRRGGTGGSGASPLLLLATAPPPYVLCAVMHVLMCASRRAS